MFKFMNPKKLAKKIIVTTTTQENLLGTSMAKDSSRYSPEKKSTSRSPQLKQSHLTRRNQA